MLNNFSNLIPLEGGASSKKIYRFKNKNCDQIILDFSEDINEFRNHLKIYNILKNINISIPKIYEIYYKEYLIVTEDFGNQRFDKIIKKYDIYPILKSAVNSLIIIHNSSFKSISTDLIKYNFNQLKIEISEFLDFFFPYYKIESLLSKHFFQIWKNHYQDFNFNFNTLVHKDFEFSNLIFLPNKKDHLQCGILDFQSAFIGFSGWDLFSLLENSRIYFTREYNEELIKYYYENTTQTVNFNDFRQQYYFLNTARQTRLLGRWIKFLKNNNNKNYLKYIKPTIKRLKASLINLENEALNDIYYKILKNANI